MNFFAHLNQRGLVHNSTPHIDQYLSDAKSKDETPRAYVGFDPSGASLQVGNLMAVLLLRRAQLHGVQPIILLGGATGLVGDPSGKKAERTLLGKDIAEKNTMRIKKQLEKFIDFSPGPVEPIFVNNLDWFSQLNFVEFLRDVGKHITINYMIAKDSVKLRMETGISYAEFGYMLMQGYDFLHLFEKYNCRIQLGGSDQWGNITTGTELIRRKHASEAHAISSPLLTDASGNKLGKTEAGAIYLDGEMTSPYQFYQYWLQREDTEVLKLLNALTLLSDEQVAQARHWIETEPDKRAAQKLLAETLTTMVHGAENFAAAEKASQVLFSKDPAVLNQLPDAALKALSKEVPSSIFDGPSGVLDLLVKAKLCASKSEARRHIQGGAVTINRQKIADDKLVVDQSLFGEKQFLLIGLGKTHLHLVLKQ
jgi:tyrosyl-tRNA synthetase